MRPLSVTVFLEADSVIFLGFYQHGGLNWVFPAPAGPVRSGPAHGADRKQSYHSAITMKAQWQVSADTAGAVYRQSFVLQINAHSQKVLGPFPAWPRCLSMWRMRVLPVYVQLSWLETHVNTCPYVDNLSRVTPPLASRDWLQKVRSTHKYLNMVT